MKKPQTYTIRSNSVVLKSNRSLKLRDMLAMEIEFEQEQVDNVKDIVKFKNDTHFGVVLVPLATKEGWEIPDTSGLVEEELRARSLKGTGFYLDWRNEIKGDYEEFKREMGIKHLSDLENFTKKNLIKLIRNLTQKSWQDH